MTRRQRRLVLISVAGAVLAVAAALVLIALSDRIVFFNSPSDVVEKHVSPGTRIRLGGLVVNGSVDKSADGAVRFKVTDGKTELTVAYQGLLPDLFREGQGVVAEGVLTPEQTLAADTVLAKHDERYMPPEVVKALKESGRWEDAKGAYGNGQPVAGAAAPTGGKR